LTVNNFVTAIHEITELLTEICHFVPPSGSDKKSAKKNYLIPDLIPKRPKGGLAGIKQFLKVETKARLFYN